ncbi:MAG: DUF4345 family protein [Anaerolineaceae bacterium]|jgi:hypothetical protein
MDLLHIIKWSAVAVTLVYGLYAMIKPGGLKKIAGLETTGARGVTEIRAVMGGTFVGLAVATTVLNTPAAFTMLGIVYAANAVIRTLSMVLDKSVTRSNAISLGVETALAILLVI